MSQGWWTENFSAFSKRRHMAACAPLIDACQAGDVHAVTELLKDHNVDAAGIGRVTPLMAAAMRGKEACVCTLLSYGADVNRADQDGDTALIRACRHDHPAIAMLLCSYDATRSLANRHGETAFTDAQIVNEGLAQWLHETWP